MKKLLSTLCVVSLASTLALADDKPAAPPPGGPGGPGKDGKDGKGGRPNAEEAFKKLDTNGDGTISLEEFKAGPRAQKEPDKADEAFKRIDKDGDGKVTLEEFKAGRPPRGPGKDGPRPGGPEGPGKGGPGGKPADPK
jgi:hypothetical protein